MAAREQNPGVLARASNAISVALETTFYKIGKFIAEHPVVVIACSFLFVVPFVFGIPLYFHEENRLEKLWVPADSMAYVDKRWVDREFPAQARRETIIIEADNVLTPAVLQRMLVLDKELKAMRRDSYTSWETVCTRIGGRCWSSSLLELWKFDEPTINSLTQAQIMHTINSVVISPMYGTPFNITLVLGDVDKDGTGYIFAARATRMLYFLRTTATSINVGADLATDEWEDDFIKASSDASAHAAEFTGVYYYAVTSYDRVSNNAIFSDVKILVVGYILIGIYVSLILGKLNMVQHRVYVAGAGMLCVVLSIAVSFGICSYAGIVYGPLHSILPFLLLGIGVDDMFVIVQALETLPENTRGLKVPERIALAMKHAGVSITVTSLTDIFAFGIGATTVIPALRSFCAYAAIGIIMTFIFQCTLFVACLTLDEKRAKRHMNALFCCYKHKDYEPSQCSQKSLMQNFFDHIYGPLVTRLPFKVFFFVLTLLLFGGGIYGVTQMDRDFDFKWFLPAGSYASEFFKADSKYFPHEGLPTAVYLGEIDYYRKFAALEKLHMDIEADDFTSPGTVQSWYMSYRQWLRHSTSGLLNEDKFPKTEDAFYTLLNTFMTPPNEGASFLRHINFLDSDPRKIQASRVNLFNTKVQGSTEEIDSMDSLREVTGRTDWEHQDCFPYTWFYVNYETKKIIQNELYRNIGLAFICIVLMVLVLIAQIWTCIMVSVCVIMAVVDVGGVMYYWGLTIDVVTSIQLILALGFAIDYSAHVGHTFMTQVGGRNERVKKTLHHIGPAVFHGGFSTFLAFVLLAGSETYVFRAFFKVFFSVVIFGLYHGLVFLPILLSWLGPDPYLSAYDSPLPDPYNTSGKARPLHEHHSMDTEQNGHVRLGDSYFSRLGEDDEKKPMHGTADITVAV